MPLVNNKSPLSYMGNHLTESLYLEPVTDKYIYKMISASMDTATGSDGINLMSIVVAPDILVQPLTYICNLSLTQ